MQFDGLRSQEEMSGGQPPFVVETAETKQSVGNFEVELSDEKAMAFAELLRRQFDQHHDRIGIPEMERTVELRSLNKEESQKVADFFAATFAPGHAQRFGLEIRGVFATSDFTDLPDKLERKNVWFHGTDAVRGTAILTEGFKVPEKRKVDAHPMYGTGVNMAEDSSKSMGYFHVDGYNDRDPNEGGIIFLTLPKREKTYVAESALWGDTIELDGKIMDWRDQFDSVYALSRNDPGYGERPNYRELTVKDGSQAPRVVAVWCRLIPAGDPRHNRNNPVVYSK